ncbi:TPR-like protein, partial [Aureobasidium melanogenum]
MSGNKAALKAAKVALDAENYDDAVTQCQIVLASDSQNYFAKLFLGRAFQKQNKLEDAAKTYNSAAEIKPDDAQAWLGLCNLYESQGALKLDQYREAALKVAEIQAAAEDAHKCQTTINKLVDFTREHGTNAQYKRALEAQLPGSPIYDFLEGRLPSPSHTYTRLIEITEEEEKQRINKEIGERRTRLGARINQVTTDVRREVFTKSNLEELYQKLIDWTNDDEVRREYEQKLLQRAYDTLIVLTGDAKAAKREQVVGIVHGMVIIKHPFLLAWTVELDWKDVANVSDLDVGVLREYLEFFPETSLGKVLKAYLDCEISPFPAPPKDPEQKDEDVEAPLNQEDRILLMSEGLEDGSKSVLAHRLVAEYYLHLEEYESAVEVARNGLKMLESEVRKSGLVLQDNKDAFNSTLATALVYHQSPKNHPEARELFNDILARKPKHTATLIGLGLILEEQEEFDEAVKFLSQALEQDPSNIRIEIESAWCDALRGNYGPALETMEKCLPNLKLDDPKARELRAQTLYRTGICIWNLDTSKAARKDRNGAYARFLSAIKTNVNLAPAYTSLGYYYADYAKDKKRARQCFQKAFELSGSEVEAAERLARSFADQGEWDIVEIVAQRVVDSGKVRPPPGSKKKGISWPFSALGVVQMTKQEYSKAIVSFLSALRISPNDYHSYVGLGESYHNSGRYNSASRTFIYAEEPHDGISMNVTGQSWFTRYMLANVNRELGEHDEAIAGLQEVLAGRAEEFGVLVALLQTYNEKAWRCVETGFYGQAAHSAVQAIELAQKIAELRPQAFNLWKAVGDACSIFYWVQDRLDMFPSDLTKQMLTKDFDVKELGILSEIDGVDSKVLEGSTEDNKAVACPEYLALSLLAYKRAIFSCANDIHAQAVAWYNLGWAEHKAFSCSDAKAGKKFLRAAVRCFKRAIELEAGNSEFWNSLGVITTRLNPKVSQHSFVRSLHLNERSAKTWCNLGVLYLINNDYELAHQAFGRAQSTDPDYAHAWLGEGLIALMMGDKKEALSHFTHAFEISDSASLISKRQYAVSVFDNLLTTPSASNEITALIQPLFALEQLHRQVPSGQAFNHLASLFSERVGDHASAIEMLTNLCTSAESDYEATESLTSLGRFALAKADLARNQLASKDFESAAENAGTALDLSAEADASGLEPDSRRKVRLSAHLTAGLAAFYLQNMDDAIAAFRSALEESNSDPDVVCLLVQVLWAKGGEEEKSVARDQLFDCIEKHDSHVPSIVLLGAIAALDNDTDALDAVRDDLASLRTNDSISIYDREHVEQVLGAIAGLSSDASDMDALVETQRAIMLAPHQSHGWTQLTELTEEAYPAQMALLTSQRAVPPYGDLGAQELAKAFAGTGVVRDAQRAIVLAPWERSGWETFADAVTSA